MRTFIGTKLIEAELDQDSAGKQLPRYRVVYPDGYVSYSPADVFEAAYKPINALPFHAALFALHNLGEPGRQVSISRAGWAGKGLRVVMGAGAQVVVGFVAVPIEPFFVLLQPNGRANTWVPSSSDLVACDWSVQFSETLSTGSHDDAMGLLRGLGDSNAR